MQTGIAIDDELAARALAELGPEAAREAIETALRDRLRIRRQLASWEAMRGLGWDGDEEEVRKNRYTVKA